MNMDVKERKALGRGFGALLKPAEEPVETEIDRGVSELPIEEIAFNPKQPRTDLDFEKLEELAQSIKIKGVLQPILVRQTNGQDKKFELIAGERRLRASKLAGFDRIPAFVKEINDEDLLEIALIENIQRDDLNPIEESLAYRNLLREHGYTQDELAKRVGKTRSVIANSIRLLQLPESIQEDSAADRISVGHARTLIALNCDEDREKLRDKICHENISVRETEELVRVLTQKSKPNPGKHQNRPRLDSQMTLNQERLCEQFGAKVTIKPNGQKGKIELEYYSLEDFHRIYSILLNASQSR